MQRTSKFRAGDAKTPEERMSVEYAQILSETTKGFINLNQASADQHDIFLALRHGGLAFMGYHLQALYDMLQDPRQKPEFLQQARDLFEDYMIGIENGQLRMNGGYSE